MKMTLLFNYNEVQLTNKEDRRHSFPFHSVKNQRDELGNFALNWPTIKFTLSEEYKEKE